MPPELSKLIQDFARPRSRPNWRKGGAFPSYLFHLGMRQRSAMQIFVTATHAVTFEAYMEAMQDYIEFI